MKLKAWSPAVPVSFAALRHRGFRAYFLLSALAMMADNVEHVISYWVIHERFDSPALGGFAVQLVARAALGARMRMQAAAAFG